MERARAGEAELRVHRFLQKRMAEIIDDGAGVAALAEHPCSPQLIERREEGILLELANEGKGVVRCARSDDRNEIREPARPGRKCGEAAKDGVAYRAWQLERA